MFLFCVTGRLLGIPEVTLESTNVIFGRVHVTLQRKTVCFSGTRSYINVMIAHNTQSSGLASVSKMAGFRPCVLILFTVFLVLGMDSSTAKENCVVSTLTLDGCPEGCDNCKSLMDYARNSTEYFHENNTRFRFLIGNHSLTNSTLIFMANITNLILIGDRENSSFGNASHRRAEIVCDGIDSGGFSFYNIFNLRIQSLSFIECSHKSHNHCLFVIAIEGLIVHNLHILNVTISNTIGFGLLLDGLLGNSLIANTHISNSHTVNTPHEQVCGNNLALYCSDFEYINDNGINNILVTDSQFVNGSNHCKHGDTSTASGIYIQVRCHRTLNITFNRIAVKQNYGYEGANIGITYKGVSGMWLFTISIKESNIAFGNGNIGGGLYMTAVLDNGENSDSYDHANTKIATPILSVSDTIFYDNKSPHIGAAVYLRLHETLWSVYKVAAISFRNCNFTKNNITNNYYDDSDLLHGGVAVHILTYQVPQYENHFTPLFNIGFENCKFTQNSMGIRDHYSRGGVFYAQDTQSINFINNNFVNNLCPGIVVIHSNLLLSGSNLIQNNTGTRGGGMVFCAGSYIHLYNNTLLIITGNYATQYGGGIYVEDELSQGIPCCFFQVDNNYASSQSAKVVLRDNSAGYAGTALYGGFIDRCTLLDLIPWPDEGDSSKTIFTEIFDISNSNNATSSISSDPVSVCFCSGSISTNCASFTKNVSTVPGFSFQVSAITLGQRSGPVRGVVNTICKENCNISQEQQNQNIQATDFQCSNLNYTIFASENTFKTLQLMVEDNYYEYTGYNLSMIEVRVQKCPFGFVAESKHHSCKCIIDSRPNIQCSIHNKSITRQPPVWIGYKYDHKTEINYIIFHPYCPLGYCSENSAEITSQENTIDQDAQCAQNRKGLLCGACKTNHSLGFGTSACLQCKHKPLPGLRVVGLIAVCGVAGILLVVLLTLLNLTVSEGTLNGLIFYANIVQVNSDIYFPPESHARPLTAFIAWLNLDFGITACFYDGMDAYAKTWLQFLFPLYIWLISGAIVYFSWKSNRVARLAGRNAVKVLATLFLLSFGKLLRTIIAAVTFTNIASPTPNKTIDISVWLPDASVHYLHGKHTPLFVLAVIAAVLSLLYTLILTFIQCLRRTPNNRMFVWVRKLKPLLDAYTGPYKNRYHFWTGLLLLVRILLFVAFAFNLTIGPVLNLSVIILVSTLLMIAIQPGIYRHVFLGLLESSMYVNLILFSTVMIFLIDSYTEYKILAAYFFGGWALVTFLGIVAYHAYRRLFGAPDCGQLRVWCREKLRPRGVAGIHPVIIPRDDSEELESEESEEEREMNATWNTPHLRESLIGSIQ